VSQGKCESENQLEFWLPVDRLATGLGHVVYSKFSYLLRKTGSIVFVEQGLRPHLPVSCKTGMNVSSMSHLLTLSPSAAAAQFVNGQPHGLVWRLRGAPLSSELVCQGSLLCGARQILHTGFPYAAIRNCPSG
jgi:hypothetical protein